MLKPGERAPDFSAPDPEGRRRSLAEFRGRWVVLYFFPKAFTPGCTAESKRFRDNHSELQALGAEVVGISPDRVEVQCRFSDSLKLTYPLLSDADHAVGEAYGVRRTLIPIDKRVTYVVDPGGLVQAVFHHEVQVSRHLDDVLHFLRKQVRT